MLLKEYTCDKKLSSNVKVKNAVQEQININQGISSEMECENLQNAGTSVFERGRVSQNVTVNYFCYVDCRAFKFEHP